MVLYPDDFDFPMSPTFHRGLEALCRGASLISYREDYIPEPVNLYTMTQGDSMGILLTQIAEAQHQLAEQRRINTMLSDQLRAIREQRQAQAQPPPQQPRARVIKR